jgi:hypothetical protein
MSQYFKWWRSSAIAVLAVAAVLGTASEVLAQQPGEGDSYNPEKAAIPSSGGFIDSEGALSEARNNGNQLDVWRANVNDGDLSFDNTTPGAIWMSINHGPPFQVGNTATLTNPAVAPFGTDSFFVIQTGTDGKIYWTIVLGNGGNSGQWNAIPGQSTPNNMAVSVAPIGQGSLDEYVVYRGSGNDERVFGTWVNDAGNWSTPINLGGGLSNVPPAICLNSAGSALWVLAIGTDNQLWWTFQGLGAASWPGFTATGQFTAVPQFDGTKPISAPSCAATNNGNLVMDYLDQNGTPNYAVFNPGGRQLTGWTKDTTHWQSEYSVHLTSSGNTVWSLFTGIGNACNNGSLSHCNENETYFKTVYIN